MRVILLANTSWYLYNFRLPLANRLREEGHEVILVAPVDSYSARLTQAGFTHISVPLTRSGLNPFQELRSAFRILDVYRQQRPDIVHQFTLKCMLYGSSAASALGVTRVLNSVTGLGYVFSDPPRRRALQALVGFLIWLTARRTTCIFQNPDDQKTFIRKGWATPSSSHLVRSSGVDLKRFSPHPMPEGPTTVILPGRILREKGVFEFAEAIRRLRERGLVFRAGLVGRTDPGNPASVPEAQLRSWTKTGVLDSWGWEEHMERAYAATHIVCLPSYYGEGVPMSLVEAAACGLPIIAADVPGCREIVRPDENGILISPRDAGQLTEALQLLIESPGLRSRLGARGRQIAAEFSSEQVLDETMSVYRQVSQTGSAAPA